MLYKRNYFELTVDETNKIKKAQQFLEKAVLKQCIELQENNRCWWL